MYDLWNDFTAALLVLSVVFLAGVVLGAWWGRGNG